MTPEEFKFKDTRAVPSGDVVRGAAPADPQKPLVAGAAEISTGQLMAGRVG